MRVFVTGGAGYVGSACLRHLLAEGHEAMAYDNLIQGHAAAIPGDRLIQGDILNREALAEAINGFAPDAVMHFAAATCVGESVEDPDFHYHNNIEGTRTLLNAMRETGVKRLLFSSTCATYGMSLKCPMNEDSPQEPFSPYARTKLTVEWMIRDFAEAYGLGFTLLRYFNAAGASPDGAHGEAHDPESHLIPIVLQVPNGQRESVTVFGRDYPTPDGTCIRDYIHVDDLASAHLLAIQATTADTREVFNIGTGTGASVMDVISACEKATGKTIPQVLGVRRPGDPPALVADPAKLKGVLGWEPQYPTIESVVETAWEWHRKHPRGYRE